jgi:NADPH:quinone reductase-like Zn-dependent oxidoreductase
MRAVVYRDYGPVDVLELRQVEDPVPQDDELLIRVLAAEVTKADCELRSCRFAVSWLVLPMRLVLGIRRPRRQVLGGYFAGVVEGVGRQVDNFSVGDDVFGAAQLRLGTHAELLCLPASYTIVEKPRNMSFAEAAAVPLGGLNALHFMRKAEIERGDRLLINGAGGSIGSHAVQIAKHMGAEVTAVDSGRKAEWLLALGADHFIDYERENFVGRGDPFDVVFDMVAGSSYADCMRCLKPKGRYIAGNPRLMTMLRCLLTTRLTDKRAMFAFAAETYEELLTLKRMIEEGRIVSVVDQIYPMDRVAEAHRRVETEQRIGAVVLRIAERCADSSLGSGPPR